MQLLCPIDLACLQAAAAHEQAMQGKTAKEHQSLMVFPAVFGKQDQEQAGQQTTNDCIHQRNHGNGKSNFPARHWAHAACQTARHVNINPALSTIKTR